MPALGGNLDAGSIMGSAEPESNNDYSSGKDGKRIAVNIMQTRIRHGHAGLFSEFNAAEHNKKLELAAGMGEKEEMEKLLAEGKHTSSGIYNAFKAAMIHKQPDIINWMLTNEIFFQYRAQLESINSKQQKNKMEAFKGAAVAAPLNLLPAGYKTGDEELCALEYMQKFKDEGKLNMDVSALEEASSLGYAGIVEWILNLPPQGPNWFLNLPSELSQY